jgi:hypothetical protein
MEESMAKTPMLCPFNNKICSECSLYRGKHYYLSTCKQYRGYIEPNNLDSISRSRQPVDFNSIKLLLEPWSDGSNNPEAVPDIKLKVLDIEDNIERDCEFTEVKKWDWSDNLTTRLVHGRHITSWCELLEMMHYEATKGIKEMVITEARFMLLSGG